MSIATVDALVEALQQSKLLKPDQMDEVTRILLPRCSNPMGLAKEVMRRGWLTVYQMNQLLQARGQKLTLGPYRILDFIGKGGVSTVFKAWHTGKHCIVALKVIHPELLSNAEALGRFEREIKIVTQLKHPNVVRAFDDSGLGATHFFAMEFVEGTDLGKLVQLGGPLAVAQACDYVRQAALGLQHAHELGLVHRDIKPANLHLLIGSNTIKVLDLGLARLRQPAGEGANLTVEGRIIGTPDWIAPEQARSARTADIRADIYSLGCTFYYLLTGQTPFPGNAVLAKILAHATEEPKPLEKVRPEIPADVANIVRKMMAKLPENRYQTPAEAAEVLVAFCQE